MSDPDPKKRQGLPPDQLSLTARQATRLSKLTGVNAEELRKGTVAELSDRLKFKIEPDLLRFRRVCGQVVKTDPVTGVDQPVPYATVHVEDTDCSFLWFFPVESPWSWLFPIHCRREVLSTVRTDACGRFCVWVPRFDIDWLLRFRRERRCFGDILYRPTVRDILDKLRATLHPEPVRPRPGPTPDPPPLQLLRPDGGQMLRLSDEMLGRRITRKLAVAENSAVFGQPSQELDDIMEKPAFPLNVPPPRPDRLRDTFQREGGRGVAKTLGLSGTQADRFARLDLKKYIGPFLRCVDTFVPEFVPIFDVPDITFRVTQDTNGDGTEEVIYSEGFFDVRWNAGTIPFVTLHANQTAISSSVCEPPDHDLPCEQPGIFLVGNMPLINPTPAPPGSPYVNITTGYAVRPNRPHPSGRVDEVPAASTEATAPLAGVLNLWGCNHHAADGTPAAFYKVLSQTSLDNGANWSAPVPVFDNWFVFRVVGTPPHLEYMAITADAAGWFPVVPEGASWLPSANLILQWHNPPDGFHRLTLQLGDAAKNAIGPPSAAVPLRIDNSQPHAEFIKLRWRKLPAGPWIDVGLSCPTIRRDRESIEIEVTAHAWATHLRSISIGASGCGGGAPLLTRGFEAFQTGVPPGGHTNTYWHRSSTDNNLLNAASPAVFRLDPGTHPSGAYSISLSCFSRAFSPQDGHVFDPNNPDVNYNPAPIWVSPSLPIAVVD